MNLANKYRPKSFDEVVGQVVPKTILKQEFESNNLKQAYLFIGHSGSGKSSVSKILANMIKGLTIELDVASHNTAEEMKELIKSIKTKPIGYDKAVIILDEIQCASQSAISSLLIFIENPPKHVIFIACTTEGDKIPDTIKNRCEVLYFLPIEQELISDQLINICNKEDIKYEQMAIDNIAKQANGSMRQAISYLDMLSNNDITIKNVNDNLIKSSYNTMLDVLYAELDNNISDLLKAVENIDANKFVQNFFIFVLDINIYNRTKDITITSMPAELKADLDQLSDKDKLLCSKLLDKLYVLQYEGRNSPILKEMFISCLMLVNYENNK